jgi:enoyl-CoA hydratase/carnithine racemase/glyoxylase-like metal-dependent hydrolase (beta-lactamase superfamily II)
MLRAAELVVTGTAQQQAWRAGDPPPVEALAGGVWSVPVPITDHPLRYTLCYVVESRRGPILIDPGWPDDIAWQELISGLATAGLSAADVHGVLVSHAHSDHHGLAGRIRDASGCWIGMHPRDIEMLRRLADGSAARQRTEPFLRLAGVPASERQALTVGPDWLRSLARTIPDRAVEDGATGLIPGRRVTARWTPGHTPGHLCFVEEDADLVFTGDHLLPRITSHVGIYSLGSGDVLGEYLTSVRQLGSLSDDTEVLPAHEYRFRGARARVRMLERHHADRLAEIAGAVARLGASTVWEIAAELHWSRGWDETTGPRRRLALAETLAHLRHLELAGRLSRIGEPPRWNQPGHPAAVRPGLREGGRMGRPRWGNEQSIASASSQVLLDIDTDAGLAWITLNRPEKRNALSVPMRDRLADLFDDLALDDRVRVIVLRGNGPSFSSGNEINEDWGQRGPGYRRFTVTHAYRYSSELTWGRTSFSQIISRSPKVVVASVHGFCAAAAYFLLAAKSDLVIAAADVKIGALEARFLGPASSVASLNLNRTIGTKAARFSGYTGAVMDAQQAFDCGFACHVSVPGELAADTDRIARAIASRPAGDLARLKARIKRGESLMDSNVPVVSGLLASHFFRSHGDEMSFWDAVRDGGVASALRQDKARAAGNGDES